MSRERWWIEAQGRAWGPYSAARLPAFLEEGRLGPDSRVGRDAEGPFARAADTPELAELFGGAAPHSAPGKLQAERPSEAEEAAAEPATPASRALLVISDAMETELPALEASLGGHGELYAIRPGLWLVHAREGAAALRNALSRRLPPGAMLLVVEAPLPHAAWFNLDGEADRALRRLWGRP